MWTEQFKTPPDYAKKDQGEKEEDGDEDEDNGKEREVIKERVGDGRG